jgi:acyl-CoA thioester hydrolase
MEEARVDYLERSGVGFPLMEARGLYSPVVGVECRFRRPTHFDEEIRISTAVESYSGIRFRFTYEMTNAEGVLVAVGASEHCFTDTSGRPVSLKKLHPDLDAALCEAMQKKD